MDKQDILDYVMRDLELAKEFINNILGINNIDNIYNTRDKNLYNIDNSIYIYFKFGNDRDKSGIYDSIRYYYKYFNNNDYKFFYVIFNDFDSNSDIVLQIRDRKTKEVLIDNFNIVFISIDDSKKT